MFIYQNLIHETLNRNMIILSRFITVDSVTLFLFQELGMISLFFKRFHLQNRNTLLYSIYTSIINLHFSQCILCPLKIFRLHNNYFYDYYICCDPFVSYLQISIPYETTLLIRYLLNASSSIAKHFCSLYLDL